MRPPDGPVTSNQTEILVVGGDRYCVEGEVRTVSRKVVDAARGSVMELAWLVQADTGEMLAVNPHHVILLRPLITADAQRPAIRDLTAA